jgi:hypothetical protein
LLVSMGWRKRPQLLKPVALAALGDLTLQNPHVKKRSFERLCSAIYNVHFGEFDFQGRNGKDVEEFLGKNTCLCLFL